MTPFALAVEAGEPVRRAPKSALVSVSRSLEARACAGRRGDRVVVALQHAVNLTPLTCGSLDEIAAHGVEVTVLGTGLDVRLARSEARWRGVELAPDHALAREWLVVVQAAHLHVALLAREGRGSTSFGDQARPFDYVVTDRSGIVTSAVDLLLQAGELAGADATARA